MNQHLWKNYDYLVSFDEEMHDEALKAWERYCKACEKAGMITAMYSGDEIYIFFERQIGDEVVHIIQFYNSYDCVCEFQYPVKDMMTHHQFDLPDGSYNPETDTFEAENIYDHTFDALKKFYKPQGGKR